MSRNPLADLHDETIQSVLAIVFFVLAVFTLLSWYGVAGPVGVFTQKTLRWLFGSIGFFLIPVTLATLAGMYLKSLHQRFDKLKMIGSGIFVVAVLGVIGVITSPEFIFGIDKTQFGGNIGHYTAAPLVALFGKYASLIFLGALTLIASLVMFNAELNLSKILFWRKAKKDVSEEEEEECDIEIATPEEEKKPVKVREVKKPEPEEKKDEKIKNDKPSKLKVALGAIEEEAKSFIKPSPKTTEKEYLAPPLSLLEKDKGKAVVGDVKANANIIQRTLRNFGMDVEMDEVTIGPSVTRYALKPAEGVKLARIVALQNDLSLALAAHPLRIEAPIPGKSLVGIEVPNSTKTTVGLGTLFSAEEFVTSDKPLLVALGKGISGKSHFANIAKMPHLLIAGATGSGKSVTIHNLIISLLYRKSPQDLKFIMIDPKRVELTLYNKIPHLLTPVITDAKKSILALKWAAKEMDRRYDVLQGYGVQNIDSYHKTILAKAKEKITIKKGDKAEAIPEPVLDPMPYIVIVIDELADLMQAYPRELESAIVRLAQMSRAVGIHLLLSTQRPSVNVITGLIKANIPSRLALQVSSQIDSRTILDQPGAEKLLGQGDMLYLGGEMSKPVRIQCAYISESEVKAIVKHLIDSHRDELSDEINFSEPSGADKNAMFSASLEDDGAGDDDDDLYEQAHAVVLEAGKASTSYIQRKLRVGYARAARLMDLLEDRGVIGPADGARPRAVTNLAQKSNTSTTNTAEHDSEALADETHNEKQP
jgi:S-DNA-T family DNA segregation ATPase FtsK/SpoIIIE